MAQLIADRRDIDFVLYDQMQVEELLTREAYSGLNRKLCDMTITEARNMAIKELLPTFSEGDKIGVTFANGKVEVPKCFHKPHKVILEGEWTSLNERRDAGGQGLPEMINHAALEYIAGANYSLAGYSLMGHGTGKMIDLFGTERQKKVFLKKLYSGFWGGTMLLTEPNAGSDVGALTTSAVKNDDGTYSISGDKIFITNGEHDLAENIIHPVLARIKGAPAGTKGISIFIVPKIWVNDDGTLGDPNDVTCTGVEEKMGIHGSATCSMSLGGKGMCKGWLLGKENQGMRIMFHMMNEARLNVGFQGLIHASSAYLYALNYARERTQGKDLAEFANPDAPQVPIIRHPDVRRMLLWMKAHVEGMRSLVYYVGRCFDKIKTSVTDEDRGYYQEMTDLLTPLVKAYCAQRGFDVCVYAMQVFGGYGYTKEYPVEQLVRDCKIASIYEGTDGIQAMDLLSRKIGMNQGKTFMRFVADVSRVIDDCEKFERLAPLSEKLKIALNHLSKTATHLGEKGRSLEFKTAFAHAFPFLESMGDVIMAWMLLWRAGISSEKLSSGAKKKDANFYEGQIKTAEFFISSVLPVSRGRMDSILDATTAAIDISEDAFGGL
jgi:alkylation response protein AidB-like acyl-CoA dehydrogenase